MGINIYWSTRGSILRTLLFIIFICDLFHDIKDLKYGSFADDNTPCICSPDVISVLETLKKGIDKISELSSENLLKANANKCQIITTSKFSNISLICVNKVKRLVIHINNRLDFDYRVSQLYKKATKQKTCICQNNLVYRHKKA